MEQNISGAALEMLAVRGVRLRVRAGAVEYQAPPAVRSAWLEAWLRAHRDELIELADWMACRECGLIPSIAFPSGDDGAPRCAEHAPGRCRWCFVKVPHGVTCCADCGQSPLVRAALEAAGPRKAAP